MSSLAFGPSPEIIKKFSVKMQPYCPSSIVFE